MKEMGLKISLACLRAFGITKANPVLKLLSYTILCLLCVMPISVAAQSGDGSSHSKGVFSNKFGEASKSGGAFSFALKDKSLSANATTSMFRFEYIPGKSENWGATLLYSGALQSGQFKLMLLYISNQSSESNSCIEYELSTKTNTEQQHELTVKQLLLNEKGELIATVTFDSKASDQTVEYAPENGKPTIYSLSKGNVLVVDEKGKIMQKNLPKDLKRKSAIIDAIADLAERQK